MAAIQQSLVWPLLIVAILLSPASDATTSKSRESSGPASEIRNHYSTVKEGELSGSHQAQSCSVGDPGCQEEGQQPLESAARRYSSQDRQVEFHASKDSSTKGCSSSNSEHCREEDHLVTVTEHFSSSMKTESACDHMHEADIQRQSVPQAVISEHPKFHLLIQKPVSILERIIDIQGSQFVNRILKDEHGNKVEEIVHDYRGCLRCQVEEVFKRWLNGDGMTPITWNVLVKALKDTGLHALADDICSYVSKDALFRPAEPVPKTSHYSYSASILRETYRNHEVELVLTGFNSTIPFLDIMLKNVTTGTTMSISDFNFDEVYRLSIAGQPGTGKTVLLWHLAKKWADYEVLQSCEILLFVNLVSLPTSKSYFILKDFFEALPGYKNLNIGQLADEIDSRNGSKACFLIDDYTHMHNSYTDLAKNLFYDRLPLSRIISTSKSHTTSKKSISEYIELLGYRDEDLNGHLSKLCEDKTVRESVLTVWKEQPTIREMSRLPLHLAMIIDIIRTESDHARLDHKTMDIELKVQTRTNIYLSFMNQKLERNKIYSIVEHCILKQNHDPAECRTFNTMLTMAFEMAFNDTNTLDYDPTVQSSLAKTGFVAMTKLDTQIHGKTQALCVFSHPTFRDFFAAFYMTTLPLDQQLAYITMYGKDVAFSNIWLFYFGLLNMYGYQADVAVLLKRYSAHYSHRYPPGNSFKFCDFEFETRLLTVVREMYRAEQSHKGFNKLLRESGIVVNSSVCLQHDSRYEASLRDKEFVEHFFSQVRKFQFSLDLINESFEVISFSLEIHSYESDDFYLGEEYVELLACVQDKLTCTYFGSVTGVQGSPRPIAGILKAAQVFPNLRTLILYGNDDVATSGALKLVQGLYPLENLQVSINCEHLPLFQQWISRANNMHLELSYCDKSVLSTLSSLNNLQGVSMVSPQNLLPVTGLDNLQSLYLIEVDISATSIDTLVKYFDENKHLKSLEISSSHMSKSVVEKLFTNLPPHLQNLILSGNLFTDREFGILSKLLPRLPDLQSLSLSNNLLKGRSLQGLAEALSSLKHFRSLDLSYPSSMRICDEGMEALAQLKSLDTLNIMGCRIPVEMKNSLINLIRNLTKLKTLHIRIARVPQPLDLLHLEVVKDLNRVLYMSASELLSHYIPSANKKVIDQILNVWYDEFKKQFDLNDYFEHPLRSHSTEKIHSVQKRMQLSSPNDSVLDVIDWLLFDPKSPHFQYIPIFVKPPPTDTRSLLANSMGLLNDSYALETENISVTVPMGDIKELLNDTLDLLSNMTVRDIVTVSEKFRFSRPFDFTRSRDIPASVTHILTKASNLSTKVLYTLNKMLGSLKIRSHHNMLIDRALEFMRIPESVSYYDFEEMMQVDYYMPNENKMYDQILDYWHDELERFDQNENQKFWTSQDIFDFFKEMRNMTNLQNLQVEFV